MSKGQTLMIDDHHTKLSYASHALLIKQGDKPNRRIPLIRISKIVCLHKVEIDTQLLGQLKVHNIDFVYLNQRLPDNSFHLAGGATLFSSVRRLNQYQWVSDANISLVVAKQLVKRKLRHSVAVMQDCQERDEIFGQIKQLTSCNNMTQLRGMEGYSQKQLYAYWRAQLPKTLRFRARLKHPSPDPVNAAMSLCYTLLYQEAIRLLIMLGLDPSLGFLHVCNAKRYALACDLMEITRPSVERWLCEIFVAQQLTRADFCFNPQNKRQMLLTKDGREKLYPWFHQELPHWRKSMLSLARLLQQRLGEQANPLITQIEPESELEADELAI